MKYKIGDKVRIKSLDWYNRHTNGTDVDCGAYPFTSDMKEFCGQERIIANVCQECYILLGIDDKFVFTDEMIEGLAEEEKKPEFKVGDKITNGKTTFIILTLTSDSYIGEDTFGECCTLYFKYQDRWKIVKEEEMSLDKAGQITDFEYEGLAYTLPEGYIFKGENGNVINETKKPFPKASRKLLKL